MCPLEQLEAGVVEISFLVTEYQWRKYKIITRINSEDELYFFITLMSYRSLSELCINFNIYSS